MSFSGKRAAIILLILGLFGLLVFASEPLFRRPATGNTASCDLETNPRCFEELRLPKITGSGEFDVTLEVTQCIFADEVSDSGWDSWILRVFGSNRRYDDPAIQRTTNEYKVDNWVRIRRRFESGRFRIKVALDGRVGPTHFWTLYFPGESIVHGPDQVTLDGNAGRCELGAIDRRLTLPSFGKRLLIGSKIEVRIVESGDVVAIEPMVIVSRFPSTLAGFNERIVPRPADNLDAVMTACAGRF